MAHSRSLDLTSLVFYIGSHHSLLKVGDVKSQICEAIASINVTLHNFGTNSFIIFAFSQFPLDLIQDL
jgi:hypothetical protein